MFIDWAATTKPLISTREMMRLRKISIMPPRNCLPTVWIQSYPTLTVRWYYFQFTQWKNERRFIIPVSVDDLHTQGCELDLLRRWMTQKYVSIGYTFTKLWISKFRWSLCWMIICFPHLKHPAGIYLSWTPESSSSNPRVFFQTIKNFFKTIFLFLKLKTSTCVLLFWTFRTINLFCYAFYITLFQTVTTLH